MAGGQPRDERRDLGFVQLRPVAFATDDLLRKMAHVRWMLLLHNKLGSFSARFSLPHSFSNFGVFLRRKCVGHYFLTVERFYCTASRSMSEKSIALRTRSVQVL